MNLVLLAFRVTKFATVQLLIVDVFLEIAKVRIKLDRLS